MPEMAAGFVPSAVMELALGCTPVTPASGERVVVSGHDIVLVTPGSGERLDVHRLVGCSSVRCAPRPAGYALASTTTTFVSFCIRASIHHASCEGRGVEDGY
jgi:hypothetical protein